MGRARKRADRIRETIPIVSVLADYGYEVRTDGGDREQQFACNLHGDGNDVKPSARVYPHSNSWHCIATDQPVLTSKGWVRLGDLNKLDVLALDGEGGWGRPLAYLPRGKREVWRLCTSAGYEVTATPDHRLWRSDGSEIELGALSPGDLITITVPSSPCFTSDMRLPCETGDLNAEVYGSNPPLALPSEWSIELGEAMGYIFGDVWLTQRKTSSITGLVSSRKDEEDAKKVIGFLRGIAGGRGSETHRSSLVELNGGHYIEDTYRATIGNNGLYEFFRRLGMDKTTKASERRLPASLWTAPAEAIRGFLRGIFATDGSVFRPKDRHQVRVNLYSASAPFLRDIQLSLLQFGVRCRICGPAPGRSTGYLQLCSGADVQLFRERIGVASRRKQAVLDTYPTINPRGSREPRFRVQSIEKVGLREVADITMPEDPSFVVGGIRVHNCFACSLSRDAIETVRANEGVEFSEACHLLEIKYGLPPLPWDDEDENQEDEFEDLANLSRQTFEEASKRVYRLIDSQREERTLPLPTVLALWEAHDMIVWHTTGKKCREPWGEKKGVQSMMKLRERILRKVREAVKDGPATTPDDSDEVLG